MTTATATATATTWVIGERVGFWYTKPSGERDWRTGRVKAVHAWGVVLRDDERGAFRGFRFDRMS